jgi:DNA-directed RNA polymerase specialized sigma24 family protein
LKYGHFLAGRKMFGDFWKGKSIKTFLRVTARETLADMSRKAGSTHARSQVTARVMPVRVSPRIDGAGLRAFEKTDGTLTRFAVNPAQCTRTKRVR